MNDADALVLDALWRGLGLSLVLGALFALALLLKSLRDFSRTGPRMTGEVLAHYRLYLVYALGRLGCYALLLAAGMSYFGVLLYSLGLVLFEASYHWPGAAVAGGLALAVLTLRMVLRTLLWAPGVIASSSHYSMTRFYALWERLSPRRLRFLDAVLLTALGLYAVMALLVLAGQEAWQAVSMVTALIALYLIVPWAVDRAKEPPPAAAAPKDRPNIVLIGADTLRADRLSGTGYHRDLTPNLAALAGRAMRFTDCYVPCARTAPSLASLLTGTWPHTHGVRDTFVTPEETHLPVAALPEMLRKLGYQTAAVGDWAVSDVSKFDFGFQHTDMPPDQWNIKYLLRQGPKDIRLFLSLFTQNRFGKRALPEIYYLGGHPLAEEVGRDTRAMIRRLAAGEGPFFLMSFMACTHPPFTSKYPYYTMYADRNYRGESKFAMARLRDPFEIIRRQGEPKTEFDLEQIIDLYDGCVKNFDDELQRVLDYLDASGLSDNTIVVVFSDHGMEFFEHETWGQGNSAIGDFSARVPLIIADPRHAAGRRVSDVVRTVDLAPTLLDLIQAPIPSSMEGTSLVPLMRGESLEAPLPAFYETGVWLTDLPGTPARHLRYPKLPDLLEVPDKQLGMIALKPGYHDLIIAAKDRMVRLGDWKLTYQPLIDGALYQLFNIAQDPACQRNVLDQYPHVARRLQSLLAAWMRDDRFPQRTGASHSDEPQPRKRKP
ncbi:MAG TPA: hypothetical protein ENJ19_09965 [Gammaproteobacteria bacterium]|nr:hypothetical protein [Gammaproteobacteria bacterium]